MFKARRFLPACFCRFHADNVDNFLLDNCCGQFAFKWNKSPRIWRVNLICCTEYIHYYPNIKSFMKFTHEIFQYFLIVPVPFTQAVICFSMNLHTCQRNVLRRQKLE